MGEGVTCGHLTTWTLSPKSHPTITDPAISRLVCPTKDGGGGNGKGSRDAKVPARGLLYLQKNIYLGFILQLHFEAVRDV